MKPSVQVLVDEALELRAQRAIGVDHEHVAPSAGPAQLALLAVEVSTAWSKTRRNGVPSLTGCSSVTQLASIQSQRRSSRGMSGCASAISARLPWMASSNWSTVN